jgi:TonB family protein
LILKFWSCKITESTILIYKIMKTKDNLLSVLNFKMILVLTAIPLILFAFSSCAARKSISRTNTEIAPSPPPPPPPPLPQQNSASKDNIKITKESVSNESDQEPFVIVEEMPEFPGGDLALMKYIAENTKYPENAKKNNIQGKVITRFCVTAKGDITMVTVLRGVNPEIDAEAVRVVSSLPAFKPGRQGGKDVPVWYMVPLTFTLNNNSRPQFEMIGNDTIYNYTNELPAFPGGNDALQKFKSENVKYPPELKSLGIEGMVIVKFLVEKNGAITDVSIARGCSPALDAEALRVTRSMPAWQPGKENGKPVKCLTGTMYEFLLAPRTQPVHKEDEPYVVVEEMPMFPGGDSTLLDFITRNTKYPETAKINNIQGRVIIRFCVTKTGGINQVSVLRGVSPELDAESIRVVSSLPSFKPGKQGGVPVDVWYMVPITFALNKPAANVSDKSSAKEFKEYDEPPVFVGGEVALYKFINSNIIYPATAKEKNITGKVYVVIEINTDGSVVEVSVLQGVDPSLDAEALRVIKLLPKWKPGKLAGVDVNVWYPVMVNFKLK